MRPTESRADRKARRLSTRTRRRRAHDRDKADRARAREWRALRATVQALADAAVAAQLTPAQLVQVRERFRLLDPTTRDRVAAQLISTRRLPRDLEPGLVELPAPAIATPPSTSPGGIIVP